MPEPDRQDPPERSHDAGSDGTFSPLPGFSPHDPHSSLDPSLRSPDAAACSQGAGSLGAESAYLMGAADPLGLDTDLESQASPGVPKDVEDAPEPKKKKEATPLHLAVASSCLLALILALLLRAFVAQAYEIRGKSMEPTLHDGEKVMISKLSPSFHSVGRGDLVIFRSPRDPHKDLIKRVVALAGDTIEIRSGRVLVNGVPLREEYVNHELYPRTSSPAIDSPVEPGHVVVLGDNRPNSQDSRHFGSVPLELVKGTVFLRWWPLSSVTTFP